MITYIAVIRCKIAIIALFSNRGYSMIILLSPAKRVNFAPLNFSVPTTVCDFELCAASIMDRLETWTLEQTRTNLNLSEQLGAIAYSRNRRWRLPETTQLAKQAVFAYDGDVYRAMNPIEFNKQAMKFASSHLRILSALYGILRPFDLIKPYRLQMSTPLSVGENADLYDFWYKKIHGNLKAQLGAFKNPVIINLASEEYYKVIDERKLAARIVKPIFTQYHHGGYKVLSIYTKKARGLMSRFIIENNIRNPDHLKAFDMGGYTFKKRMSSADRPVFTKMIS